MHPISAAPPDCQRRARDMPVQARAMAGVIDLDRLTRSARLAASSTATADALSGCSRGAGSTVIDAASVDWHAADGDGRLLLGSRPCWKGGRSGGRRHRRIVPKTAPPSRCRSAGATPRAVIDCQARSLLLQTDRFGVWPLCWSAGRRAVGIFRPGRCVHGSAAPASIRRRSSTMSTST